MHEIEWEYLIVGREIGENGTPHIQGYGELKKQTRWNTIKALLSRAHIESRRGTQEEAIKYSKKDDDFKEFGTPRKQGSRGDLDAVRQQAASEGMRSVTATRNLQQINVASKFLTFNEEPRRDASVVVWIWGPSGAGKTKLAYDRVGEDVYVKNTPNKWFDGYDAHKDVIIDDLKPKMMKTEEILAILDRYEVRVECKGGSRQFLASRIFVTSIYSPAEFWELQTIEPFRQLERRISEVVHLDAMEE